MNAQLMTITLMICWVSTIRSESRKLCSVPQPIQSQLNILAMEENTLKRDLFGTFNGSVSNIDYSILTSNIQVIRIVHIPIMKIEDGAFCQLVCLTDMDLSYNMITELSSKTFGNLTELRTLNLTMNRIKNISVQAFSGLKSLKILNLSENNILDVNKQQFVHNVQLEYLNLSRNRIKRLSDMFKPLIRLKQLLLNHCSLAMFYTVWLKNNTVLEKLDISSNQLTNLYFELYSFNKTSMKLWNCSNNCLVRLPLDNISFEFSNSATIIDFSNNWFECPIWPEHLKPVNIKLTSFRNTSRNKIDSSRCFSENLPSNTSVFVPSLIIVCCIIVSIVVVLLMIDYRAKLGFRERIIDKVRKYFFEKPLQREASYNHLQVDF